MLVINDYNYLEFAADINKKGLCGCLPRRSAYGSLSYATPAPDDDLIPWDAMPDLILQQENDESTLEHLFMDSKARGLMRVLNQGQLNYCWLFSCAQAIMLERELMGLPFIELSPSSLAYLVNFANQGGYIEDALRAVVNAGISSTKYVPQTTNDQRKFKEGWRADAEQYKVTMWADIPGSDQSNAAQHQFTQLLRKRPMPNGRNFMGHSMLSIRLLDRHPNLSANNPNRYAIKDLNSWGDNEDGGFVILEGQHAIADQCYTVLQTEFTA